MNIKKTANLVLNFAIKRLAEIFGIIVSILGLALFLALLTYSPDDPNFIFPQNTQIKNFLGFQGSFISDLFFQSVGIIAYLISITYFITGINILIIKEFFLIIENTFYSILYCIFGTLFIAHYYSDIFILYINGSGGFIGGYLNQTFFKSLILLNENLFYYLLILLTTFFFLISVNFSLSKSSKFTKKIFSLFDLCLTSNLETKKYLRELGAKNIYFNGNIKLINKIDKNKITNQNEKLLLKTRFWIAASTHEGEDIFCLKTHLKLKERYKDIITIIAPRHIERSQKIKSLSEALNLNTQVLNKDEMILNEKEIIIINSFGVLQNYFKYSKCVFIGKSMIKKLENDSGQNPIDAAKLRCKIYHGPYVYNFKDIYEILEKNNISKEIRTHEELSINLIKDLKSPLKADDEISNSINDLGQKTLTDTMKYINKFLINEIK